MPGAYPSPNPVLRLHENDSVARLSELIGSDKPRNASSDHANPLLPGRRTAGRELLRWELEKVQLGVVNGRVVRHPAISPHWSKPNKLGVTMAIELGGLPDGCHQSENRAHRTLIGPSLTPMPSPPWPASRLHQLVGP